ncbi:MAG: BrnT family toxin [Legionellales bacterium]|jgi:hypothetical protein
MSDIHFEWNQAKAKSNFLKHGISFDEAKAVFLDENARIIEDPDHSEEEDRFIILGFSFKLRLLIVCYCYREIDETIRIISSRKATRNEAKIYEEY